MVESTGEVEVKVRSKPREVVGAKTFRDKAFRNSKCGGKGGKPVRL